MLRLIGERLSVHLYHDRLLCYHGQKLVITLPRVYPAHPEGRARRIDYRHVIHSLAAKPQAFRFSQFRDELLPSARYHKLWALAEQQFTPRDACKWMVGVLRIAYDYDCEGLLANQLHQEAVEQGALPELKCLQDRYLPKDRAPDIPVRQHKAADYDQLLSSEWMTRQVNHG